jgi:LytS/YehU family sensor histidine kinase
LNAIQQFLGGSFILSLEDVVGFKIGGKEALGVLVSMVIEGSEEHFLGSALIKQDKTEATVAAVLNAVNRKISFIVKENTV